MYESRANQPGFLAFVYIRGCLTTICRRYSAAAV
jgi:hypothetical protein